MTSGRLALFYSSGGVWIAAILTFPAVLVIPAILLSGYVGIGITLLAVFSVHLGCGWMYYRTRRVLFRRLRSHWLAVCPTCLYPLKSESVQCPECGRAITRRHARMFWFGILFVPANAFKSESRVLRDGQIWRDQRRDRIRLNNWRFGLLARRNQGSPGPPSSMS